MIGSSKPLLILLSTSLRFVVLTWNKYSTTLPILLNYRPRSRPYLPIATPLLPFFRTIKSAPEEWFQVSSLLPSKNGERELLDCHVRFRPRHLIRSLGCLVDVSMRTSFSYPVHKSTRSRIRYLFTSNSEVHLNPSKSSLISTQSQLTLALLHFLPTDLRSPYHHHHHALLLLSNQSIPR